MLRVQAMTDGYLSVEIIHVPVYCNIMSTLLFRNCNVKVVLFKLLLMSNNAFM